MPNTEIRKYPNRIYLSLLAILLAWPAAGCSNSSRHDFYSAPLPVLCYHAIENHSDSVFNISDDRFEKQMQYLSQNDYHTISLKDLSSWLAKQKPLPPRSVLITFDDGHQSDYEKAYPILKRYGFTAAFFITAEHMDINGRLSTRQVREMIKSGFSVGSHGTTHKAVVNLAKDDMIEEILGSKLKLEKKLDHTIEYFAYPSGFFDKYTRQAVETSGYKGAFTVIPGSNGPAIHRYELKRILVTQSILTNDFIKLIEDDKHRLARLWQSEIPQYLKKGLLRPAEIEARALLAVDRQNRVGLEALQVLDSVSN